MCRLFWRVGGEQDRDIGHLWLNKKGGGFEVFMQDEELRGGWKDGGGRRRVVLMVLRDDG